MDHPYTSLNTTPQQQQVARRGLRRPRLAFCGLLLAVVLLSTIHPTPREKVQQAWQVQRNRFTTSAEEDRGIKLDKVVVFGDSLSDDGTGAWKVTKGTWPNRDTYAGHRFCNGPVYSEYMAQDLLLPLVSYATGGASISTRVSSRSGAEGDWPVDCILEQIRKYVIGKSEVEDRNSVFILYAGGNDAYFGYKENTGTPADVIEDLKGAIKTLRGIGAQYFILPTLPPLGDDYPYSNVFPDASEPMHAFSTEYRERLIEWAKDEPGLAVADFYGFYTEIMANPTKYGFDPARLKEGCLGIGCKNPEGYIWFDDFHPVTRVQRMLADNALEALDSLTGGVRWQNTEMPAPEF